VATSWLVGVGLVLAGAGGAASAGLGVCWPGAELTVGSSDAVAAASLVGA
jgi:hypothetical protein